MHRDDPLRTGLGGRPVGGGEGLRVRPGGGHPLLAAQRLGDVLRGDLDALAQDRVTDRDAQRDDRDPVPVEGLLRQIGRGIGDKCEVGGHEAEVTPRSSGRTAPDGGPPWGRPAVVPGVPRSPDGSARRGPGRRFPQSLRQLGQRVDEPQQFLRARTALPVRQPGPGFAPGGTCRTRGTRRTGRTRTRT